MPARYRSFSKVYEAKGMEVFYLLKNTSKSISA